MLDRSLEQWVEEYTSEHHQQMLDDLGTRLLAEYHEAKDVCYAMANAENRDLQAAGNVTEGKPATQRYLFAVASWIYFQRTCRKVSGPTTLLEPLLSEAYNLLPKLECTIPFPFLLIGSEASTDERRFIILECLQRMQTSLTSGGRAAAAGILLDQTARLLELLWVKDDLHDDREGFMDYSTKMHCAVTSWDILPALI